MDTKSALGSQLKRISEVRKAYEQAKKSTAVAKIADTETKQLSASGFKILINPTKEHELILMEETFSTLQNKLDAYERVKELYPRLQGQNMKIGVILDDGLPTAFMLYTENK
jgi:flagellar motility protein MotE (MotC chaperone)